MLEFQDIKDHYPKQLQGFDRAILREYLQCKILQGVFMSIQASQLSFLGGTALRIIFGNQRFSEDIDLDNFGLTWVEFEAMIQSVERFLEREGFEVEINLIEKGAYHCILRFPRILYQQNLTPIRQEKIRIQIDTASQGYEYQPEILILNRFEIFSELRVTPLNILLSQKIYTAVNRKRPMGRDFYDITFLLGRTKPDYGFLEQKMNITSPGALKKVVLERMAAYDFEVLADDVAPFLFDNSHINRVRLFKKFWQQADLG